MKTAALILTVAAAAGALTGCAGQAALAEPLVNLARSGIVQDATEAARLEKAMTDGEIANLLDLDVKAKLPTRLAVAKLGSYREGYQPHLARIDAEELEQWSEVAAGLDQIPGVHPVTNLSFGNGLQTPNLTLRSLRVAAARMHCELLLVYMQGDSRVDNFNDAAALYWTLLGLWVVPGNTLEHKTIMQAIVVDCRTGMILGTATGSSHVKKFCAAAYKSIHEEKIAKQAPVKALADLRKGVKPLLEGIVAHSLADRQ